MKQVLYAIILLCFLAPAYGAEKGAELFRRAQKACSQSGTAAFIDCVSLHKRAASQGWVPSMRALGNVYLHRDVFRENIGRYVKWYDFAARSLGVFYAGCGLLKASAAEAADWFSLAADKYGDPVSAYALGNIYSSDYFFTGSAYPDFAKAAFWYGRAASAGYAPALYALGDMAFNGKGTRQDYGLAVQYFAAASAAGDAEAAYMVGRMYYEGIGVEHNFDLALEQLNLASERGSGAASELLEKINEEMK